MIITVKMDFKNCAFNHIIFFPLDISLIKDMITILFIVCKRKSRNKRVTL